MRVPSWVHDLSHVAGDAVTASVNASPDSPFELRSFFGLAAAYGVIALIALVQLIRIHLRVPEYGWTTQKVFHMLNFLVASLRAGVFACRHQLVTIPIVPETVLLDLPSLLFFTTYTLLVLFWAEIYHQARSLPTGHLRPGFVISNVIVYIVQGGLWVFMAVSGANYGEDTYELVKKVSACFVAAVSVLAACGFVLFGGRLFVMLRRFPIESKGRRKKLREVGCVTFVCTTCFVARAFLVAYSVFNAKASLDVLSHPVLNIIYYASVEVVPSLLVLFILRKLPPKRHAAGYHAIS